MKTKQLEAYRKYEAYVTAEIEKQIKAVELQIKTEQNLLSLKSYDNELNLVLLNKKLNNLKEDLKNIMIDK